MLKALVVDDHPFIRSTVIYLLKKQGFDLILEATNGADGLQMAREHKPNLVVLDLNMPKLDGIEVINRIKGLGLQCKILVLTSYLPIFYSTRCMRSGAMGFVAKTGELDELLKAIEAVMRGYTFFPSLDDSSVRRDDLQTSEMELIQQLSNRELSVLVMLSQGLSNKNIAIKMLLSHKTISTYKTRLQEKLNVKSTVQLADLCKRNSLL